GIPTGNVILLDGTTVLAIVPLENGMARYTTANLSIGHHALTARYDGSGDHLSSVTDTLDLVVGTLHQRWVAQAYRDLLQRQADPSGLATFTNMLDQGTSYYQVALLIQTTCSGTPLRCEYWEVAATNLYRTLLRREPDPQGL